MEKRNLKRAIAKFEELAADDDYEGNRKIINLDAFLKGDLKSKKKKKKDIAAASADNFESTPIKCNKNKQSDRSSDSFDDDQFEDSSIEIRTADQFLKKFLSQPPLVTDDKMKKKTPAKRPTDRTTSGSAVKRAQNRSQSTKSTANKSATNSNKSTMSNKSSISRSAAVNKTADSIRSTGNRSMAANKSVQSKSISNLSSKSEQSASRIAQLSRSKERVQKDGDLKLKEQEKQFLLMMQNRKGALEDEEYDDEEESDDEFEEDESGEEDESLESLDDESIDPETSLPIDEQHLRRLNEQQEFDDESIGDEEHYSSPEELVDEESDREVAHHRKSKSFRTQQASTEHRSYSDDQRKQSDLVRYDPGKQQPNSSRMLYRVRSSKQPDYENPAQYVLNLDYQRSATRDLYNLILKEEQCSLNVLAKLIKNIKRTLGQDELPEPSRVRPFFHFTPDNEIHVTFLFINPNAVYYNPWDGIISTNYSELSILFEKIYQIIFSLNIIQKRGARGEA